jgi:phosphatidylglycerol:prolipoprotein diacylglycerol transferase
MYPRVSDLFRDLLGIDLPFPIYSFGLMVAVAILVGAALMKREMDRMHAAGQLPGVRLKVRDGKGRDRFETTSPSALVWTLMLIAAAAGIAGSKLFYFFEQWPTFVRDPLGVALSPAGLTFYGGLICGSAAIAYYVRRKGLPLGRMADAVAPALMLGYGIGRIGCYLAGDGDWGICSDLADKPAWIPAPLWSEMFPNNILGVNVITDTALKAQRLGFPENICAGADGVYPTMLYETAVAVLLFGVLWMLRRHSFRAGWLFWLYLLLTGAARFVVEEIRLNPDVVGSLSQAQLISIALAIAGLVGLIVSWRRATPAAPPPGPNVVIPVGGRV